MGEKYVQQLIANLQVLRQGETGGRKKNGRAETLGGGGGGGTLRKERGTDDAKIQGEGEERERVDGVSTPMQHRES